MRFQNRLAEKQLRTQAVRMKKAHLHLEQLEDRLVLDAFLWTGVAGGGDLNWSNRINWQVGGFIATRPPGTDDDVTFSATQLRDSVADTLFIGTVKSLTIEAGYTRTITLDRHLQVTTTTAMASGTIAGNSDLLIQPSGATPAIFNWTGGTISGTAVVNIQPGQATATLNISGSEERTLNQRTITNRGTTNWTDDAKLKLTNSAVFDNFSGSVFNATPTNAGWIDGNNEAATAFRLTNGATLNSAPAGKNAVATFNIRFENTNALVNVNSGEMALRRNSTNNGNSEAVNYLVAAAATLQLVGNTHTLNNTRFSGTGAVYFADSTIAVNGLVLMVNIIDASTKVEGGGTLRTAGTYEWFRGEWAGDGVMLFHASATLKLSGSGPAAGYQLGRRLDNHGTVHWDANADIHLSKHINNLAGAQFHVNVNKTLKQPTGVTTGRFNNAGLLQKNAPAGTAVIDVPFPENLPGGRIIQKSGTFKFTQPTRNRGAITVESGDLQLVGNFQQDEGSVEIWEEAKLDVTGTVSLNGGVI